MEDKKKQWTQAGVIRGSAHPGSKAVSAIQVSIAQVGDGTRFSFGVGIEQDGQFQPRAFIPGMRIDEYISLLVEARATVLKSIMLIKLEDMGRALAPEESVPKSPANPLPVKAAPLKATLGDMLRAKGGG